MARNRPTNLTRVSSRILALLSIATILLMFASHTFGEHWEYFAIYSQKPVVIDGDLEFGKLYPQQPYVIGPPTGSGGPFFYGRHWPNPPAYSMQRKQDWTFGLISKTHGNLIPPWGWGVAPTYGADREIPGQDPKMLIPYFVYRIPLFYIAGIFAMLPLYRSIAKARRSMSWKPGTCEACGYDLRATPDRCPECGTARSTAWSN